MGLFVRRLCLTEVGRSGRHDGLQRAGPDVQSSVVAVLPCLSN